MIPLGYLKLIVMIFLKILKEKRPQIERYQNEFGRETFTELKNSFCYRQISITVGWSKIQPDHIVISSIVIRQGTLNNFIW